MAFPNDSVNITPGSGGIIATHLPTGTGKDYQVIILADPGGHLQKTYDSYAAFVLANAKGASQNYLAIANYPASGVMVEITGIAVWNESTAAVTGLERGYRVFRLTSISGGTQLANANVVKLNNASPNLVAGVAIQRGSVVTITGISAEPIAAGAINEEETGAGGTKEWLFRESYSGRPILLSTGEGVVIQQDATAGVGTVSAGMYFRTF